jgi:putative PIN family toxin of toxin-antitoxin system
MRVFLDTNVIVAAVATRGLCADVMREVLARHDLVVSAGMLEEVASVLEEKIGVPAAVVTDLIAFVREGAVIAVPTGAEDIPVRDQADRALVSAALNGRADLFVTGDAELLELREIGPLAIVSPRGFWERLKSAPGS